MLSGALLLVIPAHAEEARKVFLDGVEMTMTKSADNNGLEITYAADVPPALREVGVTAGTMLIRGQWEENILIGEAWAFSKDCKPISYAIRGVVDYGGSLVIFGPVPTSCKPEDYEHYSWGKAAVMRFDQPERAPVSAPERSDRKRKSKQEKPKAKAPPPKPKPRAAPRPTYQQPYQQQWPGYPQQWRW